MTAPWDMTDVIPLPGYRLAVRFLDGTSSLVNLAARVTSPKAGIFRQLQDETLFARVYIDHGAVTWPGEIDLAPDAMHSEIRLKGEWKLLQRSHFTIRPNETMTEDFARAGIKQQALE